MDSVPVKQCCKCGESKPATPEFFSRNRCNKDGLQYQCKVCASAHQRIQSAKNAEARKARCREWRAKNAERVKQYRREHNAKLVEENPEHYREDYLRRAEYLREYARQYRLRNPNYQREYHEANPEKMRSRTRNRRARLKQAPGKHTAEDVQRQLEIQAGKCHWCGTELILKGEGKFHVDHVIPVSKGGSNSPENLVCACPSCNFSKCARMPWEFAGRLL